MSKPKVIQKKLVGDHVRARVILNDESRPVASLGSTQAQARRAKLFSHLQEREYTYHVGRILAALTLLAVLVAGLVVGVRTLIPFLY